MAAKILIVDESATVQAALRTALPSNEYRISTVATTLELLAACATSAPDAILLGLTLQGVDCSELLRSIQQQRLTSNTPVIILACQSADPQIGRALDAGAVDCICQPVSDFVVQARVRNALQTSRLLKERRLTEESENAAAKTRNDMLAEISREIRTTMTTILGYTDVLIDENRGQAGTREPLETIKRNGRELLHVVDDVLDVSQIEAGTLKVGQLKCSPRQLVAAVISQMQAKAEAKGLRLESSFVESVPLCVRTDPTRLLQVLGNLVGSAIRLADVSVVRVITCLSDQKDESTLQFDVIGTGLGVIEPDPRDAQVLLTPNDPSLRRGADGEGLQLMISRQWARALGGDVAVLSADGRECGYRLTISAAAYDAVSQLARAVKAAAKSNPPQSMPAPLCGIRGCRILFAEDGLDNQRLISFILRKEGAHVTIAENGQVAVDLVSAAADEPNPFDVILMDMFMPVLDGFNATRKLREEGFTGPILALTANAIQGAREMCIEAGCDEYITKPVDRRKLVKLIADHVEKHRTPVAERTV